MSSIFVTKLCELFNRPDTMTDDAVWRWIRTESSSISMEVTYELEEGSLIEIVDVSEFEATVLPSLFPVPLRYSQFESLLLCHGFCIQSQTPNTRSYKHRYFNKGDRDAAEKIALIPNADLELEYYFIETGKSASSLSVTELFQLQSINLKKKLSDFCTTALRVIDDRDAQIHALRNEVLQLAIESNIDVMQLSRGKASSNGATMSIDSELLACLNNEMEALDATGKGVQRRRVSASGNGVKRKKDDV